MQSIKNFSFVLLILILSPINLSNCKKIICTIADGEYLKDLEFYVTSCNFYRAIIKANDSVDINYKIYGQFGNLTSLVHDDINYDVTRLKFKNSYLATISNRLFIKFPNTKVLDASHSKLKSISSLSLNKSKLFFIFLYHNRLTVIKDFVFVHCPELLVLDLSQNEISEVEKFAFKALSKLQKLDLSMNKIQNLEDGTFQDLTSLEWLWLSKNQISRISMNLFTKSNRNLVSLFMINNQINSISPDAFFYLENLKFLFLTGNECVNKDFKNHLIHNNLAILAYELKVCHKNHREKHTYEPDRTVNEMIEEIIASHAECQGKTQFYSSNLKIYEHAIEQFLSPSTTPSTSDDEDNYFEGDQNDVEA